MTELLAHLFGDYVLQSHVMATRKTSSLAWALIHATFYTLPFLFLTHSPVALAVILGTHALIDRFAVARRWCEFYGVGFPGLWWRTKTCECGHDLKSHIFSIMTVEGTGGPPIRSERTICGETADCGCDTPRPLPFPVPPPVLGMVLIIVVDNAMHLLINHIALCR